MNDSLLTGTYFFGKGKGEWHFLLNLVTQNFRPFILWNYKF